jgi:hypothetical protein
VSRLWQQCTVGVVVSVLSMAAPAAAPQGERAPGRPDPGGEVFVGGYFYDPAFGPYPWWPPASHQFWYLPPYGVRALVRLDATPDDAAVYVDGFYAGLADDFDGVFQQLPLTPGPHRILLHRPGYRWLRLNLYLRPGSTFTLPAALQPIEPGEPSPLPPSSTRVPPPVQPESYRVPLARWPGITTAPQRGRATHAPTAWLDLHVEPTDAVVLIDGEPWLTSSPGHVVVDVDTGPHRIWVARPGFVTTEMDVTLRLGDWRVIGLSLEPET